MKLLKIRRFLLSLINRIKNNLDYKKPQPKRKKITRNKYGFPELH